VATHFWPARFALVLIAAACGACVSKPTMRLDHAEISGVQLASIPPMPPTLGIVMTVVLDVYNPNSYDVAVRAVRGQTVFAGQYPLAVQYQAPPDGVWMPAGQTTQVRVPITVPVQLAVILLQQSFQVPSIDYRFTGTADVTATRSLQLEKDNYSVDQPGTITRNDMLAVIPASIFPH
jgi:Late embryogenesis abundant protein